MKILTINPGSTSTKIAVFEDREAVFEETIRHDADEIGQFQKIVDQFEFRKKFITSALKSRGMDLTDLDVVVGRGGLMKPIEGGVYAVNQAMLDDLADKTLWGREHASNLGAYLAKAIGDEAEIPAFITDPVTVDEMCDLARMSGVPEIKRKSLFHALNVRACARKAAEELKKDFSTCHFVVIHMGGGVSVVAVKEGRCIDVNNALLGMGPFSPQRAGALPTGDLIAMCFSGEYSKKELEIKLAKKSGLIAYTGTDNGSELEKRASEGDKTALMALEAMGYQIVKEAGGAAALLCGNVDAVIFTGGLVYAQKILMPYLRKHLSFLGKQIEYPGEKEMEALADAGYRVMTGIEKSKIYG
ncbi:MAG TPA: butyrate kinase [Firmicutes bacterium]|nr:butyrate kinase [Bacillota bacterium]